MGLFDPGMGVISGLIRGEPTIPQLPTINLGTEQSKAISQNQAALPALEATAGQANQFSLQQLTQALMKLDPGYAGQQAGLSADIGAELSGKIPEDVQNAIQENAAARSLGSGTEGSGMARDLVAKDLGLTSLNLIDKGISSAESWMQTSAAIAEPTQMNFGSMFVTPGGETSLDVEERDAQFERAWGANQLNWQGSFGTLMGNEIDQDSAQFNQMASSIVGKVAGTAIGGAMGGSTAMGGS